MKNDIVYECFILKVAYIRHTVPGAQPLINISVNMKYSLVDKVVEISSTLKVVNSWDLSVGIMLHRIQVNKLYSRALEILGAGSPPVVSIHRILIEMDED